MIKVFSFPPVAVVGHEWTETAPISVSRSLFTGREYISAHARRRKQVTLSVSALGRDRLGAGYMEALKRLLDGGVNCVRLQSYPINWWLDGQGQFYGSNEITWFSEGTDPLPWETSGGELTWYSGLFLFAVPGTDAGVPSVSLTDLPANTQVARPGDFVTVYTGTDDIYGQAAMVVAPAVTDGSGNVTIRLAKALPEGRAAIGLADTGIFRTDQMPRAMQPVASDWNYTWNFRQVFPEELGSFTEVNPWA
jgi:hypothetical protein